MAGEDNKTTPVEAKSSAETQTQPALDGRRIADYVLEYKIGSGGMGSVFHARQISMCRPVAVKILLQSHSDDAKYMERFFREVRTLAQLEHQNIVRAIEAGIDNGVAFLAMEYVPGLDLKHRIDMKKKFSELEALTTCREIASALAYAWNRHRIVHRDIKPANIIIANDNEVKLLDLGISKHVNEDRPDITAVGMMVGSPTFISPEQARGDQNVDFRADMYSLGTTMFNMLTGKPPYHSNNSMVVVSMHLTAPIPNVREVRPDVSERTSALIRKMMAKKKDDRFDSWEDVIAEMDSIIDSLQPEEQQPDGDEATAQEKNQGPDIQKQISLIIKKIQMHRLIALCIALVLFTMAFVSVISKSLKEAKLRKQTEYIASLIAAAEKATPENRDIFIKHLRTNMMSSDRDELKQMLADAINRLEEKESSEVKESDARKRAHALTQLKDRSFKLEAEQKYAEALKLWQAYSVGGQYKDDPVISAVVKNTIEYLTRKIQEKETGLYE